MWNQITIYFSEPNFRSNLWRPHQQPSPNNSYFHSQQPEICRARSMIHGWLLGIWGCYRPEQWSIHCHLSQWHFWRSLLNSSLGLVEKPGSSSLWMIHHHSKEDSFGQSTNGWIDTSLNATKYYSATNAADIVSTIITISQFFPIYHLSPLYNLHNFYMVGFHISTFIDPFCVCCGGLSSFPVC